MSDGNRPTGAGRRDEGSPAADWLSVYLKGAAMGAADTVPGVSGGTIALITGIYERLIRALTSLDPRPLAHLPRAHRRADRRKLIEGLREMDLAFLIVLGLGVATAVVSLSRVVHAALVAFRPQTFAFFFGLIAASAIVLYRQLALQTAREAIAGVAGFAIAFALSGATAGGLLPHTLPVVFLSGTVAVTALVLPGISGAFILLLLGQYDYLTGVLTELVDRALAPLTGGSAAGIGESAVIVAAFGTGAVVGLLTVAHAIRFALDRHRLATLAFLVSLMVGSLRLPVVEVRRGVEVWTGAAAGSVLLAAVLGAALVLVLDYTTDDLTYAEDG